jgi:aspartyl aminopeptidase
MENQLDVSRDLLNFINQNPTAHHTVDTVSQRLLNAGFSKLNDVESWKLEKNHKYFTIHHGSALVAWIMGDKPLFNTGFRLVGAHTDSPGFHIKSHSPYEQNGYLQLGVEIYGSPIIASWADRDLGIAGRVAMRENGAIITKLYRSQHAVTKIVIPAIHLNRDVNEKGLLLNKQTQTPPIFGLQIGESNIDSTIMNEFLAAELKVDAANILHWDLELFDTSDGQIIGLNQEFISSARIDNLAMCHASISALIEQTNQAHTSIVALFDNEEIGSQSINGASGSMINSILDRILKSSNVEEKAQAFAKSFCISADGAHGIHPNYAELYEPHHNVNLNGGPVVKINANHRYASSLTSIAVFKALCQDIDLPVQEYIHRTDLACGSTIGPITEARLGIPVVDVGTAMLGMHSIRETAGSKDQMMMIRVLNHFFKKLDLYHIK